MEPHRHGEAGCPPGKVEIYEREVRAVKLGRGDGAIRLVRDPDNAISGIVLDQKSDCGCELRVVLDDQYPQQLTPPRRTADGARERESEKRLRANPL
jgi:hypothetical protein